LGFIGLGTVALAQLFGARTWAFSNQESSLEMSKRLGAISCRKAEWASHHAEIAKATQGDGIDLVVITSNSWSDWRLALELARKGGVICVLGFPGRGEAPPDFNPLDSQYFYDKQLSLIACGYTSDLMTSPQDMRFTIRRNCSFLLDLILSSRLDPSALITEVRPWRDIEKVYASAASRTKPFFTGVLNWSEAV
jgi:threonine dehydrogenase-like Zn-dependent dehydrogenase